MGFDTSIMPCILQNRFTALKTHQEHFHMDWLLWHARERGTSCLLIRSSLRLVHTQTRDYKLRCKDGSVTGGSLGRQKLDSAIETFWNRGAKPGGAPEQWA